MVIIIIIMINQIIVMMIIIMTIRVRVEVGKGDVTNGQNSQILQLSYPNGHQPSMNGQEPCQQSYACGLFMINDHLS